MALDPVGWYHTFVAALCPANRFEGRANPAAVNFDSCDMLEAIVLPLIWACSLVTAQFSSFRSPNYDSDRFKCATHCHCSV